MENINNNMDLLNTEKLENDFSNFNFKDLFSKDAAKKALLSGNPLAAVQYANKQDKLKMQQQSLAAQIEAAKANKDLALAQQKTQELQAAKTKAEEDAAKAIDAAIAQKVDIAAKEIPVETAIVEDKKEAASVSKTASASEDKILGMPKNIYYGAVVALVAIGGFFIYKKFIKK